MGRDDWYRRKAWTAQDRDEFLARLKRSRSPYSKAQSSRIQAVELLATKKLELVPAALELLDMVLAEWPEETSQRASTYEARAECFVALGRHDEAVVNFNLAFEEQRRNPKWPTGAHLSFAWFVVTRGLSKHYEVALARLDEKVHKKLCALAVGERPIGLSGFLKSFRN